MKKIENVKTKILVNTITGIRTIGSILMIPLYLICGGLITSIVAGIIFATDFIDGFLARKLHAQTFFGSLLDALSDKLLGISILIILSTANMLFLIPICLELSILLTNSISAQRGNNVKTIMVGKIKTVLLDISLVVGLFSLSINEIKVSLSFSEKNLLSIITSNDILRIICVLLIISQFIVLIEYIRKAIKEEKKNKKEKNRIKKKKVKKTKKELFYDLFDTEFFLNNRDGGIKKLLYINEENTKK